MSLSVPAPQNVPGPRSLPLVGDFADFYMKASGFKLPLNALMQTHALNEYYKKFGQTYRLNVWGEENVFICNPEDIITAYRNEGKDPAGFIENLWIVQRWAEKYDYKKIRGLLDHGDDWRSVRQSFTKDIISPQLARTYLPFINEACQLASPNLSMYADRPDEFSSRLSFDMFASALFGIQMQCAAGSASHEDLMYVANAKRLSNLVGATGCSQRYLKLPLFKYHPINRECEDLLNRNFAYGKVLMERALEASSSLPDDCKPLVAKFLSSGRLTCEAAQEIVAGLLMFGVDTTECIINWNMLHLAMNPDKQQKLRSELTRVLGSGPLTPEVAQNMKSKLPYLCAVVREAHRLTPSQAVLSQRVAPYDLNLSGFLVPKGTKINFQVYSLQNDPRYVENPDMFEPARWLPDAVASRRGTDSELIDHKLLATPFSFGARMCPGSRIATLEVYAMLSRIVRDWRFEVAEGAQPWKNVAPMFTKALPFPGFCFERC